MSDLYEPDSGSAFYRSRDPINNLQVRTRLERASTAIVPQVQIEEEHGGKVEMVDIKNRLQENLAERDADDFVFSWQQKVFSKREYEKYTKGNAFDNDREKKYKEICDKLEQAGGRPTRRLFTIVDEDPSPLTELTSDRFTTNPEEVPTKLSETVTNLRYRKVMPEKKPEHSIVPRSNIVDYKPNEERKTHNRYLSGTVTTMYIMADLNPANSEPLECNEVVLVTIKMDSLGVLSITPDFNKGRKAYKADPGIFGREMYEYTVEHASQQLSRHERDREMKMYKELYNRHTEYLAAQVGHNFEMPPIDMLRLLVYGEIETATNFEYDDLFIQYFVELPDGWFPNGQQSLCGVTQTCRTRTVNRDQVAYFSFPFSFELVYQRDPLLERKKECLPKWPQILLEVQSIDGWQRYRVEGYGCMTLPMTTGPTTHTIHCWRPQGRSIYSELRRFFIGGSPELEDLTYVGVPSTHHGSRLSKFGFRTVSTGSVQLKLNCLQQSQAFLQSTASKKKVGTILDKIGFSAAQANILSVIEAFQQAKRRMINAREHLKQNFIETLQAQAVDEG